VLFAQGNLEGARQRLERALEINVKVFGTEEHPAVAASLHELAGVLIAENELTEAVATFRRVLDIEANCYGTRDHYRTAETEISLAMLLRRMGQAEEAEELLQHAIAVLTQQVPGHPILAQLRGLVPNGGEHEEPA